MNGRRNQNLVAIDVDGSLISAGGPIETRDIELLEDKGILWGILSSRSKERAKEACDAMGIKPKFLMVCRVDMRTEELKDLARQYQAEEYIYVADRSIDAKEAKQAQWKFIYANKFRELGI